MVATPSGVTGLPQLPVGAGRAAAGWSVISRERCPRWGADLDYRREQAGVIEWRAIEVKGTSRAHWGDIVLQQSQIDRARGSAAAGDDERWLAICTQALHPAPPPRQLLATWVATHWPAERVRRAAGHSLPAPNSPETVGPVPIRFARPRRRQRVRHPG